MSKLEGSPPKGLMAAYAKLEESQRQRIEAIARRARVSVGQMCAELGVAGLLRLLMTSSHLKEANMKKTRLFIVRHPEAGKSKKASETGQGGKRRHWPKPKRIPMQELEPIAGGAVPAVDAVVMARVRTALALFDAALVQACIDRRLLPHQIVCAVEKARFLSNTLVPARTAQMITGVRASILLAECWFSDRCAGLEESLEGNDFFDAGKRFSSVEASFLDHANRLSREPRFQAVMRAKDNPEYLKQLGRCQLWNNSGRADRVAFIVDDHLQKCDALLPEQRFEESAAR